MRVHGNQIDSNIDLNGLYGAAKTEAKLEAERTRKKLLSAALAGEYDDAADCVVSLSGENAPGDETNQQETQSDAEQKSNQELDSEKTDKPFSGWA